MSLSSWSDFRASRGDLAPMDDACRDLVLSGHVPGRKTLQASVLAGDLPPEAAELIASAKGRAALAKRAQATGDDVTALLHVEAAEGLVLRANELRLHAVKRRRAAVEREWREREAAASATAQRALAASAQRQEWARQARERNAERERRAEAARQEWADLLGKNTLPDVGKDGGLT